MGGANSTDAFFNLIAAEVAPELANGAVPSLSHWMVVSDAAGVIVCRLDDETEGMAVDSVLAGHIDNGASAAAFLTVQDDSVLAQVLIAEPRNSDLRRAPLDRDSGELQIGSWRPEL